MFSLFIKSQDPESALSATPGETNDDDQKINEIEPFVYLKATLEAIAAGHPANRIDELLPWNFKPSS